MRNELLHGYLIHHRKYRDRSHIVHLFTQEHGRVDGILRQTPPPQSHRPSCRLSPCQMSAPWRFRPGTPIPCRPRIPANGTQRPVHWLSVHWQTGMRMQPLG